MHRATPTDDTRPRQSPLGGAYPYPLEQRRRRAVASFVAAAGPSDLRTVVRYVTALEYDPTVESSRLEWRQRVHVSLRRTHLPLLEEEGIVDYDDDAGTVRPGGRLATIEPVDDATSNLADDAEGIDSRVRASRR